MYTIAVIDDDVYIGDMLEEVLTKEGYAVLRAYSGTEALLLLGKETPDLILLDLMLPGLSGEEVLAAIKEMPVPVIVISAKVDVEDKVRLLLDGAADYLTKPFVIKELLARITVQLRSASFSDGQSSRQGTRGDSRQGSGRGSDRRQGNDSGKGSDSRQGNDSGKGSDSGQDGQAAAADEKPAGHKLAHGGLELDLGTREARVEGTAVHLTRTEYAILKYLMQNPGQVLTKTQILERISADTPDCMESSLKVHISNLRKKLQAAGAGSTDGSGNAAGDREYIESVWGIGFKLGEM